MAWCQVGPLLHIILLRCVNTYILLKVWHINVNKVKYFLFNIDNCHFISHLHEGYNTVESVCVCVWGGGLHCWFCCSLKSASFHIFLQREKHVHLFEVRYTHLYIIQLLVSYKTQLKSILHFHTLNDHIFIEECVLVIKNTHGFV